MVNNPLLTSEKFRAMLAHALENGTGFAAGKISISHIQRLNYSRLVARQADPHLLKAVESNLIYHSFQQQGIFPPDPAFYLDYNEFYAQCLKMLDVIGVFPDLLDKTQSILSHYEISTPLIDFHLLEPDRSVPDNPLACYLPLFRERRILIICPFAQLLASRANQQTFEQVWAKTGKRWFAPNNVEGLELPYGFEAETARQYGTSFALYKALVTELQRRDFEVALIAAAGLAIPLATAIKSMGRIALDIGGHLQALFGVIGKRWRDQQEWQDRYFNESWIDMPEQYRPSRQDVCDFGAYW